MTEASNPARPKWWNDSHETAWDTAKRHFEARLRDERPDRSWEDLESAVRYGYAARLHYAGDNPIEGEWDPETESRLESDWDALHNDADSSPGSRTWNDVRQFVHRGWLGP
jgi:hypothetical protein